MPNNLNQKQKYILAVLSPAKGSSYTPVQVQKLFFLIDKNIPKRIGGPYFHFIPFNYGPFDKAVYQELNELARNDYVEICPEKNWRNYRLTDKGQRAGEKEFARFHAKVQDYLIKLSAFVRKLSFTELVSVIYRDYPDMRKNSVFQE